MVRIVVRAKVRVRAKGRAMKYVGLVFSRTMAPNQIKIIVGVAQLSIC